MKRWFVTFDSGGIGNCGVVDAVNIHNAIRMALPLFGLDSSACHLIHVFDMKDLVPGWKYWR